MTDPSKASVDALIGQLERAVKTGVRPGFDVLREAAAALREQQRTIAELRDALLVAQKAEVSRG